MNLFLNAYGCANKITDVETFGSDVIFLVSECFYVFRNVIIIIVKRCYNKKCYYKFKKTTTMFAAFAFKYKYEDTPLKNIFSNPEGL